MGFGNGYVRELIWPRARQADSCQGPRSSHDGGLLLDQMEFPGFLGHVPRLYGAKCRRPITIPIEPTMSKKTDAGSGTAIGAERSPCS